jgi:Tfp pilus assembly protein PilF
MPTPWIFTFYSFKGGVGRSLAAANVAYTLAGWGRHVLLIDMDLEAPGLSSFLARNGELDPPNPTRQNDVLSFLSELLSAEKNGADPAIIAQDLPPISAYTRPVAPEKLKKLTPKMGQLGRLDVLGVDQDRNYAQRLASLSLNHRSRDELLSLGRILRSYLKSQRFLHRPFWLEDFQPSIPTPYDYVIVDSRTGLTEVGGLCVGPLADRLVVLTGLNDQNIKGTRMFLDEVGIKPEARPNDATPWDEDDDPARDSGEPGALGAKPTIVVASPVPAGEIDAKRARLEEIRLQLGVVPRQISYHPQMALLESIFVRDFPEEYLTGQYIGLTDAVQALVGDNESCLVSELSKSLNHADPSRTWDREIALAVRLAPVNASAAQPYLQVLANFTQDHCATEIPLLALASQNRSFRPNALGNWGNALLAQAKEKGGEESDHLFAAAYEKYAGALQLEPGDSNTLNNWGAALLAQAEGKAGTDSDPFYAAANEKYAEALKLKPDHAGALINWGNALSAQARGKAGVGSDHLYTAANDKYAQALKLRPDHADGLYNWGNSLSEQARGKSGGESGQLYAAAYVKYAAALKLKPDHIAALNNWGTAMSEQAKGKSGAASDQLCAAANEKYSEALKVNPYNADVLRNWGIALSSQAKGKAGAESYQLYAAAKEKYEEAVRLSSNPQVLSQTSAVSSTE